MNWRQFLFERLAADVPFTDEIPTSRIFGAGSKIGQSIDKPFVIVKIGDSYPELLDDNIPEASSTLSTIWVHDEPGSYVRIDRLLLAIRSIVLARITSGDGIACLWQGDSVEFSDDALGTITRNVSFRMTAKESQS